MTTEDTEALYSYSGL